VTNSSCEANYLAFRKRTMLFEIFVKRGGGGRVPPTVFGVGWTNIELSPPPLFDMFNEISFLGYSKIPNAWYAIHQKL
jgi:hypothetical protein